MKKTTNISITQDEIVAVRQLLTKSNLGLLDSVRLAIELHESAGKNLCLNSLRKVIRLGVEAMKRERASVTTEKLYEIFCSDRSDLRSRTLSDYRHVWRKIQTRFPAFLKRKARSIDPEDMREILLTGFRTPRQQCKARSILHSLFTYAERRRWITNNPVTPILIPRVREKEIVPLSLAEIRRLLDCVRTWESGSCAPAAGLMLFAGIRPREVERLHWRDIDFEENVISIRAINSKTGGTRHVTICAPLRALLLESVRKNRERAHPDAPIVPPNWETRWQLVRRSAGWNATTNVWRQDVLRHTFASYHAKFYRDYHLLQSEMGHANANLLRTRYISMLGITRAAAENFWTLDVLGDGAKQVVATRQFQAPLPSPRPNPPRNPKAKTRRKTKPKQPKAPRFRFQLRAFPPMLTCAEPRPPEPRDEGTRIPDEKPNAVPAPEPTPPPPSPRTPPETPRSETPPSATPFRFELRPFPPALPCAETEFFRTSEILRDVAKGGFIELPWLPPADLFPPPPPPLPPDVHPLPFELNPPLALVRGGANFRC